MEIKPPFTEREEELYRKALDEGVRHAKPSPLTREFMEQSTKDTAVIAERIEGLKTFIAEKFDTNESSHDAILAQTTRTNGRVSSLERWRTYILGGFAVVLLLGAFVFNLFMDTIQHERIIDIQEALEKHDKSE